jgi:hypothetical protein
MPVLGWIEKPRELPDSIADSLRKGGKTPQAKETKPLEAVR